MLYYGEKLLRDGRTIEAVLTPQRTVEVRTKVGKLIVEVDAQTPVAELHDKLEQAFMEHDHTPTFAELYNIEVEKPSRREVFLEDVARVTGRSKNTVRQWAMGEATPSVADCITLSKYFGIHIDELFNEANRTEYAPLYTRHSKGKKGKPQTA